MTNPTPGQVWQDPKIARAYLDNTRAAIPCAEEQIDLMLRLLRTTPNGIHSFIDLGCGDGVLGAAILSVYPEARGIFIDFSKEMLDTAQQKLGHNPNLTFIPKDYGQLDWINLVQDQAPFDAIVSGYSIHHQPDDRKHQLYQEIFALLAKGAFFINVEHVSPSSDIGARLFGERFIDSLYALEREQGGARSREQIEHEYHNREDRDANILAPVEVQCDWLRHIGYADVDCHLKLYELAVFAGRKP